IVLSFGWEDDPAVPPGSTTLEITLTPDASGTHVRLVHRGLPTTQQRDQHAHGWQHYLARLSVAAGGGDPRPDPDANLPAHPPDARTQDREPHPLPTNGPKERPNVVHPPRQ